MINFNFHKVLSHILLIFFYHFSFENLTKIFADLLISISLLWQPECSALLDALEHSACNPEIASVLARSLHRILQLAGEQTVSSFMTLDAMARVLKVACIQAQEFKRLGGLNHPAETQFDVNEFLPQNWQLGGPAETAKNWFKCMEDSIEVFNEYLATTDDAKNFILHNSKCIDCLFDLFWEKGLTKHVLQHILGLMKVFKYS